MCKFCTLTKYLRFWQVCNKRKCSLWLRPIMRCLLACARPKPVYVRNVFHKKNNHPGALEIRQLKLNGWLVQTGLRARSWGWCIEQRNHLIFAILRSNLELDGESEDMFLMIYVEQVGRRQVSSCPKPVCQEGAPKAWVIWGITSSAPARGR